MGPVSLVFHMPVTRGGKKAIEFESGFGSSDPHDAIIKQIIVNKQVVSSLVFIMQATL